MSGLLGFDSLATQYYLEDTAEKQRCIHTLVRNPGHRLITLYLNVEENTNAEHNYINL